MNFNKNLLLTIFFVFISNISLASEKAENSTPSLSHAKVISTFSLSLDRISVQQLAMLFYDQCEKRGLVFDPNLNKIEDVLTLKTTSLTCEQTKILINDVFSRIGVAFENHPTYDVVRHIQKDERADWQQFIYRPRFRDPVELADQCAIAFSRGSFAHQKKVNSVEAPGVVQQVPDNGTNGAALTSKTVENLIFYGPRNEANAVQALLQILDVPYQQVEISAALYEYQSGNSAGSAVNAVLKLFNSKIGVSIGGGSSAQPTNSTSSQISATSTSSSSVYNTLSLNLPDFSAALSLLDSDSHFRSVSRPRVLARSGQKVSFTTGQDVMIPGPITINASGQSLQSLQSVTAGVIFEVTPTVRLDAVDVNLHETVSDFVPSPNSNPSTLKRDLTGNLMMRPGVVYVIGGLNTNSQTMSKQTLFGFKIGEQFNRNETEILLLLTVKPDMSGV